MHDAYLVISSHLLSCLQTTRRKPELPWAELAADPLRSRRYYQVQIFWEVDSFIPCLSYKSTTMVACVHVRSDILCADGKWSIDFANRRTPKMGLIEQRAMGVPGWQAGADRPVAMLHV